ncbi:MAG: tetratricopeptide repeat protein [Bacteroidetes bacterium]|nr:MAG: tetratricopeptide repeat protein [Bacteroidota bacterium]
MVSATNSLRIALIRSSMKIAFATTLFFLVTICSKAQEAGVSPDSLLLTAIKNNDLGQVKACVSSGANVNTKDDQGVPALMWAAYYADLDMVRYLITQGADPSVKAIFQEEGGLLNLAAASGKSDLLKYLIESCKMSVDERGLNRITGEATGGRTPLKSALYAVQPACVDYLIARGADTTVVADKLLIYYNTINEFKKAVAVATQARELAKTKYGDTHVSYLTILNYEALSYHEIGEYEKAANLYLDLLKIIEREYGKENDMYSSTVSNLGSLYHETGQLEKALPIYLETLTLTEKAVGKDSKSYGISLNNLGVLYTKMGNYEQALEYLLEGKEHTERTMGKENDSYPRKMANLGRVYVQMGEYDKALRANTEALEIFANTLGYISPDYASMLSGNADIYKSLGDYEKALSVYQEALNISEQVLGKNHQNYGTILSNIGNLYRELGNYPKALEVLQEAIQITEIAVGREHPVYGTVLQDQAFLHAALGNRDKARGLYHESLTILEKSLGKTHPQYLSTLSNTAVFYRQAGEYSRALALHQEVLAGREIALGKQHPDYGSELKQLGILYEQMGEPEKAGNAYAEMNRNTNLQLQNRFPTLNEQLQTGYLRKLSPYYDRVESFMVNHPEVSRQLTDFGYNNQLLLKGLLMENQGSLLAALRDQQDSSTIKEYAAWKSLQRILARQYMLPRDKRLASIGRMEEELEKMEIALAGKSTAFRQARQIMDWKRVQKYLRPGEAAIEFSHFNYYDPRGRATDSVWYVAYVVKPDSKAPEMIYLFEEQELKALVSNSGQRRSDYVANLYARPDRGVAPVRASQKTLYELIWKPLEPVMDGIKGIYYAPSGLLHRINISAIPVSYDETLGDIFDLHQRGNTRSLAYNEPRQYSDNKQAELFGAINFDLDSTKLAVALELPEHDRWTGTSNPMLHDADIATRSARTAWQYLPGTEREIKSIRQTLAGAGFTVNLEEGSAATEERYQLITKQKTTARILHLATHGYFFPDPSRQPTSENSETDKLIPGKASEHPMVRSGLILAGANYSWQGNPPLKGLEDGILTAYEISQSDLSDTELVVLSACETGLGDIAGNEGVYGLQRAFKIAGAEYIIMSLWQVPDKQSSKLMSLFYTNWLESGLPLEAAFYAAQKEMRELYEEPYFWAGFVLVK